MIMKIKYILIYYTKSKYLGMKKQHIEIYNNLEELVYYREKRNINNYEMYKQII